MITHEDDMPLIIPTKTNYIILGTMGSMNARIVNGVKPESEYFYYNDGRNQFWKIIQNLYSPQEVKNLTVKEKKEFVKKHSILLFNIVRWVEIENKDDIANPSDTVLFDAFKQEQIEFKQIPEKLKKLLKARPIYFTCREKKGIKDLLLGFLKANNLPSEIYEKIHFLKSPTRCNAYQRSLEWKNEMHF